MRVYVYMYVVCVSINMRVYVYMYVGMCKYVFFNCSDVIVICATLYIIRGFHRML